jgi:hypothetical protein
MLAFRSVLSVPLRELGDFLYTLKAGPAGGRLRRPSSRRQPHDGHRETGLTLHARQVGAADRLPISSPQQSSRSLRMMPHARHEAEHRGMMVALLAVLGSI